MIDVSIVIVCMNNLKNLYPCLESIRRYTTCNYEVLVTAFNFTDTNYKKVTSDFPWVKFIRSQGVVGFSENNNISLKHAVGEYCFVLNDDTYMEEPVVDKLLSSIRSLPKNVAIVSPDIRFPDGRYQICGRPPQTWNTYILKQFHLWSENKPSKYINQKGLFQSYNILGAAFLIKMDLFRSVGFFDEQYYFCPEDIALSTKLNQMGYKCYVDADVRLFHIAGGSTWSPINSALKPTGVKGSVIFFADGSMFKYLMLASIVFLTRFIQFLIWSVRSMKEKEKASIQAQSNLNVCKEIFSKRTPKEIFIKYYQKG